MNSYLAAMSQDYVREHNEWIARNKSAKATLIDFKNHLGYSRLGGAALNISSLSSDVQRMPYVPGIVKERIKNEQEMFIDGYVGMSSVMAELDNGGSIPYTDADSAKVHDLLTSIRNNQARISTTVYTNRYGAIPYIALLSRCMNIFRALILGDGDIDNMSNDDIVNRVVGVFNAVGLNPNNNAQINEDIELVTLVLGQKTIDPTEFVASLANTPLIIDLLSSLLLQGGSNILNHSMVNTYRAFAENMQRLSTRGEYATPLVMGFADDVEEAALAKLIDDGEINQQEAMQMKINNGKSAYAFSTPESMANRMDSFGSPAIQQLNQMQTVVFNPNGTMTQLPNQQVQQPHFTNNMYTNASPFGNPYMGNNNMAGQPAFGQVNNTMSNMGTNSSKIKSAAEAAFKYALQIKDNNKLGGNKMNQNNTFGMYQPQMGAAQPYGQPAYQAYGQAAPMYQQPMGQPTYGAYNAVNNGMVAQPYGQPMNNNMMYRQPANQQAAYQPMYTPQPAMQPVYQPMNQNMYGQPLAQPMTQPMYQPMVSQYGQANMGVPQTFGVQGQQMQAAPMYNNIGVGGNPYGQIGGQVQPVAGVQAYVASAAGATSPAATTGGNNNANISYSY